MFIKLVFLVHFFLIKNTYLKQIDLTSSSASESKNNWFLKDASEQYKNLAVNVPGGIYTDLMEHNVIGNVFYGFGDTTTRWIAKTNWTYYCNFTVQDDLSAYRNVHLILEGVDTFSVVFLNNEAIGVTENMFVRYVFRVEEILKTGANTLEIRLISPILIANQQGIQSKYRVPPDCPPDVYNGECHVNQIRKMQSSFSWDWGPALPSMGIWKPLRIELFNTASIRYVLASVHSNENDYTLNVRTYLATALTSANVKGSIVYSLQVDTGKINEIINIDEKVNDGGEIIHEFSLHISTLQVKKWWPNGYGEQHLYNLSVLWKSEDDKELSSKSLRIGFRKIELIQDKLESGLTFYFKVNDVPIFAKGANQIPIDVLPENGQNRTRIYSILKSVKDTNMNMLRVWGGGVYESDYFYDLADEFGILIWQDFMFACAMYPSTEKFLKNVVDEVSHQIKRIGSHPSIALWAGNNENEAALSQNWYNTAENFTQYKNDYVTLYVNTIKTEMENLIKNAIFLTSSPSNGRKSIQDGYVSKNPQNIFYGDVHFYNYMFDSLSINTYPIPRFASEYGYQSSPSVESWLTSTNDTLNLQPTSSFMAHRQHHPLGQSENLLLIGYQLDLPKSSSPEFYKVYIFYSQIIQAISIKFETEYYRSFMRRIDYLGRGYTMGALYWQLNDVWVAPTWSGIDYNGNWKMLHYFARDFFAPTIITAYMDITRQLKVYLVSEMSYLQNSSLNLTLTVTVYNWSSFQPVNINNIQIVNPEYGTAVEVFSVSTDDFLQSLSCGSLQDSRKNCFFHFAASLGAVLIAPENYLIPDKMKNANIQSSQPKIASIVQMDVFGRKFEIQILCKEISLFVWLDSHEIRGRFSENGFLQKSALKTVFFTSELETTAEVLGRRLSITNLKDTQYFV